MTIDEAIEILEEISEWNREDWLDFEYASLRLGIEALKTFRAARPEGYIPSWYLLPGETEK